LFGVRILVTRPLAQSDPLRDELSELGADVLVQPAIEIGPPPQWNALDSAISRLSQFDWLVFSSANGVRYLLDRLWNTQGDMRAISAIKLAAIGPGTADELARYHLRADLMPPDFRAESFAKTLSEHARGKRLLLVRASRGREVLATQLLASGAHVEQVVAYSSHDVERANPDVADLLSTGKIDWITVTSSAIARSLFRLFGEELSRAKLASISPVTSQTLRDVGLEPAAEASPHTMAGLVQAICAFTAA
jgi:uroporphyrinogen III methyltransferase/synthase